MPGYHYEFLVEQYGTKNLGELAQLLYKDAGKEYHIVAIYAYKHSISGNIEIQTCGNEEEIKELYSSPYCKEIKQLFPKKKFWQFWK